jgi:hypothetical protein
MSNKSFQKKFTETFLPPLSPFEQYKFELHTSNFQDNSTDAKYLLKNKLTLDALNTETSAKIDILITPKKFNLTIGKDLSRSNTKALFKNLYGETLLTYLFFSEDNVNNIQKILKMMVFKEMDQMIDDQSNTDLLIIMRSIFLEYSRHPKLLDETMSDDEKNILLQRYTNEVSRLNELVINELVPLICSQLQQYLTYLKDASTPRFIMEKPMSMSVTGQKQYRSITNLLAGGL